MGYQVTQINDLEQFGELSTTFLLVDDEAIMPDIRVEKVFKITDNLKAVIERQKRMDCLQYEIEYLNNL